MLAPAMTVQSLILSFIFSILSRGALRIGFDHPPASGSPDLGSAYENDSTPPLLWVGALGAPADFRS